LDFPVTASTGSWNRFARGDDAMAARASFATGRQLHATQFRVIGAFCRLVVPYFAWATKRYRNIPIGERFEVLSLVGDITLRNGPA
jgi:predicted DNA-binding protein with PD1-like motif